jgi:hypothetical protein
MLWIYSLHSWQLMVVVAIFFLTVNLIGTLLVRWWKHTNRSNHPSEKMEVSSAFFENHGVYLSILVGLLAVGVYGNMTESDDKVHAEAVAASALYRCFSVYPQSLQSTLQEQMREYLRHVVEIEWPQQQAGESPKTGQPILQAMHQNLIRFEPATRGQEVGHGEALEAFRHFNEKRRERLFAIESSIEPLLWYVVIAGAVLNMILVWLMDLDLGNHLLYGSINVFFQAALIGYILAMDNPFMGELSVDSKPYQNVLEELDRL